jgi:hypothetical protein
MLGAKPPKHHLLATRMEARHARQGLVVDALGLQTRRAIAFDLADEARPQISPPAEPFPPLLGVPRVPANRCPRPMPIAFMRLQMAEPAEAAKAWLSCAKRKGASWPPNPSSRSNRAASPRRCTQAQKSSAACRASAAQVATAPAPVVGAGWSGDRQRTALAPDCGIDAVGGLVEIPSQGGLHRWFPVKPPS